MSTIIKAIYAGARSIGLDQDAMREFYQREVGKHKLTLMNTSEKYKVLDALRVAGAKSTPKGRKKLTGPYVKKLQALWISAWNLGVVKNRDDKAMLAFIKRQTGIENTAFLRDPEDAKKAVEALKNWIAREGKVDWSIEKYQPDFYNNPKFQVVVAQVTKLRQMNELREHNSIIEAVRAVVKKQNLEDVKSAEWIGAQQGLGEQLRKLLQEQN